MLNFLEKVGSSDLLQVALENLDHFGNIGFEQDEKLNKDIWNNVVDSKKEFICYVDHEAFEHNKTWTIAFFHLQKGLVLRYPESFLRQLLYWNMFEEIRGKHGYSYFAFTQVKNCYLDTSIPGYLSVTYQTDDYPVNSESESADTLKDFFKQPLTSSNFDDTKEHEANGMYFSKKSHSWILDR